MIAQLKRLLSAIDRFSRTYGALPLAPVLLMVAPVGDAHYFPLGVGGSSYAQMPAGDADPLEALRLATRANENTGYRKPGFLKTLGGYA